MRVKKGSQGQVKMQNMGGGGGGEEKYGRLRKNDRHQQSVKKKHT